MSTIEGERPEAVPRISDALLIAGIPLVGYLFAFVYEAGFAAVFDIPLALVSLSLTSVFVAAGATLIFVAMFVGLGTSIAMLLPKMHSFPRDKLLRLIFWITPISAYVVAYGRLWHEWITSAIVVLGFVVLDVVLPLLARKGSVADRLAADEADRQRSLGGTLGAEIFRRLGSANVATILWLVIALQTAYAFGKASALTGTEFPVLATGTEKAGPERVVLRIYGDTLIAAPFDRATRSVERTFVILKTGNAGLVLRLERIGPLHVAVDPRGPKGK